MEALILFWFTLLVFAAFYRLGLWIAGE